MIAASYARKSTEENGVAAAEYQRERDLDT